MVRRERGQPCNRGGAACRIECDADSARPLHGSRGACMHRFGRHCLPSLGCLWRVQCARNRARPGIIAIRPMPTIHMSAHARCPGALSPPIPTHIASPGRHSPEPTQPRRCPHRLHQRPPLPRMRSSHKPSGRGRRIGKVGKCGSAANRATITLAPNGGQASAVCRTPDRATRFHHQPALTGPRAASPRNRGSQPRMCDERGSRNIASDGTTRLRLHPLPRNPLLTVSHSLWTSAAQLTTTCTNAGTPIPRCQTWTRCRFC